MSLSHVPVECEIRVRKCEAHTGGNGADLIVWGTSLDYVQWLEIWAVFVGLYVSICEHERKWPQLYPADSNIAVWKSLN